MDAFQYATFLQQDQVAVSSHLGNPIIFSQISNRKAPLLLQSLQNIFSPIGSAHESSLFDC